MRGTVANQRTGLWLRLVGEVGEPATPGAEQRGMRDCNANGRLGRQRGVALCAQAKGREGGICFSRGRGLLDPVGDCFGTGASVKNHEAS